MVKLWVYLDTSEDTLAIVRQLPDDQWKQSQGGDRKVLAIPLKKQLFITLARLRCGMDEELLADLWQASLQLAGFLQHGLTFYTFS